jgi:PKD repeat protein
VNSSEGCSATNTQTGLVNIASFTNSFSVPDKVCDGSRLTFNNTSDPAPIRSYWLADGINIPAGNTGQLYFTFNQPGLHTVSLINDFGQCKDSVTKTIDIKKTTPLGGFLFDVTGNCGAPVTVNFKDTLAASVKRAWNFNALYSPGDTNSITTAPSYVYTQEGEYKAQLTIENTEGCSSSTSKTVRITSPYVTVKNSGPPKDCGPYTIAFSAVSSTEKIAVYKWDFGDGSNAADAEPTHLYSNPGRYAATLSYRTASGCTGNISAGVFIVTKKPVSDFKAPTTAICGNNPVLFNAVPQGEGIAYQWFFGDGSSAGGGSSISHQYTADTVYSITLITSTQNGCKDTMVKNAYITVLPPFPKISGVSNTCDGTRGLVNFSQASKKATKWDWDFGDGIRTTILTDLPGIPHTYTQSGKYRAVLSTSNAGCTVRDTLFVPVLVKQSPVLTATALSVCNNGDLSIKLNNLDNNPAALQLQNHYNIQKIEYTDAAIYSGKVNNNYGTNGYWINTVAGSLTGFEKGKDGLRIIVQSATFGCADTSNNIPLDVKWSEPGYEINNNNVCFKSPVTLKDNSTSNSKIVSRLWAYGDGITENASTAKAVTHSFSNPGSYYVRLTITDVNGCTYSSNSNSIDSIIIKGPKASFNAPAISFITVPISFSNTSNAANSVNPQYYWEFGDGAGSAVPSPVHTYSTPGEYTVKLISSGSASSCPDTVSRLITINNFRASFTLEKQYVSTNNCPPIIVLPGNTSINYSSLKWDFGDGSTAENLEMPTHIYERPGKFMITLHAYGPQGLEGTYIDSVTVKGPDAVITVDKKEGCIGHLATFKAVVKNTASYTWDFGDGNILSQSQPIASHQYNMPGKYKPFIVLTDSSGCKSSPRLQDNIIIRNDPAITFSPAMPVLCRGSSINVLASGGVDYKWLPAAGLNSTNGASVNLNPLNNAVYTVKVTDDIGCSNIGSISVDVVQPLKISTL